MMGLQHFTCLLFSASFSLAAASNVPPTQPVTPEIIYNFNKTTQPENNILRLNGQLLVTDFTGPYVFQLDPQQGPSQIARSVHLFQGFGAVTGIVELRPDIFAVAVGNSSANTDNKGTWGIWTLDLTAYQPPFYNPTAVRVRKVVSIPHASLLDGLTKINPDVLAAGEPNQGAIYKIDLGQRTASVLAGGLNLQGRETGSSFDKTGINGLKYRNGKLYFTNTGLAYYGYIRVDGASGKAQDGAQIHRVYSYPYHLDDFNFSRMGNAYLATGDTPGGGILRRDAKTPDGRNGSELVVHNVQPNSVTTLDLGSACGLFITSAVTSQILRVLLRGPC